MNQYKDGVIVWIEFNVEYSGKDDYIYIYKNTNLTL